MSASSATPHEADAILAEEAFADIGDWSVVVAEEDDVEESDPVGTGVPFVHAVAPEPALGEKQWAEPTVPSNCNVPACDSPFDPPVRLMLQLVPAYAADPASRAPRLATMTRNRVDHLPSRPRIGSALRVAP